MPNSETEIGADSVREGTHERDILPQKAFLRMLALERKRTERSHRCFVLMLLESETLLRGGNKNDTFDRIVSGLSNSTRETDIKGWYKDDSVIGVIFTEIGEAAGRTVASALLGKVTNALCSTLRAGQIDELSLSFHFYPEDSGSDDPTSSVDTALYPDLHRNGKFQKRYEPLKRSMDITGSLLALIFLLPILLLIAVLIKLTSKGPVLFKQERRGQLGKTFTFLKFRSMYVHSDDTIHKEYVKRFIAAQLGNENRDKPVVYKITADPRVTPIGRLLRRTSLDELPQFLNVLRGDMSLVGPRPPVRYEFAAYDIWHRRRLLAVKPGITGLWQVQGRSRVTFDEMVRLDVKYAQTRSLWLDVKILLQTPLAMLMGDGAY